MLKKSKRLSVSLMLIIISGLLIIGGCSSKPAQTTTEPKTLFAYVGANLKDPVSELAQSYEEKTGVKIELTFNNSGSLLSQLETSKKGDIYMPGALSFVEKAKNNGHIDQVAGPIAYQAPVIITPKGNPANVTSIQDLAKEGVKLLIPDKEATAIGKSAYKVFNNAGLTSEIEKNITANLESPAKVLAAITMGQGNAGIVEYSNTKNREKIDVIEIDSKINIIEQIPIATLVYTTDKTQAEDFIKYVQENGSKVFEKYGFKITK